MQWMARLGKPLDLNLGLKVGSGLFLGLIDKDVAKSCDVARGSVPLAGMGGKGTL